MFFQRFFIVVAFTIVQFRNAFADTNYCDPKLCQVWNGGSYNQEKNIACNNNGGLAENCPSDATLADMENYKDLVLKLHNDVRNKIATGTIEKMKPAARMTTMWSPELKYMAELNCKRCIYEHDKCRNTPSFPHSGQNIGIVRTTGSKTPEEAINQIFNDWFKEHKHAHMHSMTNFTGSGHGPSIGHFTQVVQDNALEVGCGLIGWHEKHNGKHEQATYFVCNYAMGNIEDQPIYVPGSTAALCVTGNNPKYEGLCSIDEVVVVKSTSSSN